MEIREAILAIPSWEQKLISVEKQVTEMTNDFKEEMKELRAF